MFENSRGLPSINHTARQLTRHVGSFRSATSRLSHQAGVGPHFSPQTFKKIFFRHKNHNIIQQIATAPSE